MYTPYQILGLSSGVWLSLLLDIRCLLRRNMTLYSRLQNNVLAKFVDTTVLHAHSLLAVVQCVAIMNTNHQRCK